MLIGDRAGGTTHVTQNILLGVDDLLRWASYSAIIVAKCALAYDGEIVTGKNKIGHIYLERNKYPEAYLFEPIYRWWIKHKSKEYERWNLTNIKISLDVPINEGVDLIMKALQFIETTSYRLENLSRHRDRIAIPED